MAHGDVGVEEPPPVPKSIPVNPLARLMPLVMLVAAVGMMAVYFTSGATTTRSPMYMFFPVMMLSSILGTIAFGVRGGNRSAEVNQDRQRYLRYLDTLDSAIANTTDDQRRSQWWSHPGPEDLWSLVGGHRMWERRPEDPDFGDVRVGCGDRELSTRLVKPDLGPVEDMDPVTVSAMDRLVRQRSVVSGLPITVGLQAFPAVTIAGDADAARALLRAMVCQLAVLHGPDHLAIAAVVDVRTGEVWDWLKWLPHHLHSRRRDAVGPARLVYGNVSQALSDAASMDGVPPRHLVVILDGGATTGVERVASGANVTVLAVGAATGEVVTKPSLRLQVAHDGLTIDGDGDGVVQARPDSLTAAQATACARRLAPYRPNVSADDLQLTPERAGWLGLMGIDDAARIDPERQWASGAGQIRPVPIGVSEDGAPVYLDINEAARQGVGPHGLCVGATGSGKSEFLRTLALGMMTTHSPDTLNLILVDFKGGATFLGLERARHVAAVITNLADEAHLVTRMNDALSGEMNRRQELLRATGSFANVFEYERARSRGAAIPPLPALFIMVDEFSELLSQHPDFAELFTAVGRLGRSLGMHLLLASQRLDEGRLRGLETHLSYRVCLKTFSASESRAVLGVPDAYHLPSLPGAALLKTATGDLVRLQTAFVSGSAPGRDIDATATRTSSATAMWFTAAPVGTPSEEVAPARGVAPVRTVLEVVMDRLAGRGTPPHQVWLPPLAQSPTLDGVMQGEGQPPLTVPIGLVDIPFEQRRGLLVVDLAGAAGNVAVVGAPQSGKSMALRTLVLALAEQHDPADVGFYCLDFGGGALSSLRGLPHVGSVAGRLEVDLCRRTIAVMESVLRTREARFRRLGVESMADYRRRRAAKDPAVVDDPYGDVFLVVDGWATLRQEFEGLEAAITAIAMAGLSYGVHVVVTASRWAELRPALKDQIATRIELRLGDPADSEMDRRRARELAGRPPGRGMTATGRELVIALPRWDGKPTAEGLGHAIDAHTDRLFERWAGRCAPPVALLPTNITHRELVSSVEGRMPAPEQLLIGLGERELKPIAVDFAAHSHLLVLGEAGCGKTAALRLLCREIIRTAGTEQARIEIVDIRRTMLGVVETEHLGGYAMSPASLTSRLRSILDTLSARMPGEDVTQQQLRTRSWWSGPDIYLVIDDYDLAAGATGNPLAPLADFLPHAKDLGLHLVVARRSGGAARAMFDPVLARLRELGCMGLMMSASPDEGVLLGAVRPSHLPPGRGTLIARGDADQIIQVGWTDPP